MVDEQVIPTMEAAERLGVDVVDVYRMIDEGRLVVVRLAEVKALIGSAR